MTSSTSSRNNQIVEIPANLNLWNIYYPRFHLMDLISTRRNPFSARKNPPRPPNSFFLMKNCYMLELRLLGYRFSMPDVCRQAKLIWHDIPQEVKDRYDQLAFQAQILHQEIFPGYKFSPKKRTTFKPYVPVQEVQDLNMTTFTVKGFFKDTPPSPSSSSLSSNSSSTLDSPIVQDP